METSDGTKCLVSTFRIRVNSVGTYFLNAFNVTDIYALKNGITPGIHTIHTGSTFSVRDSRTVSQT